MSIQSDESYKQIETEGERSSKQSSPIEVTNQLLMEEAEMRRMAVDNCLKVRDMNELLPSSSRDEVTPRFNDVDDKSLSSNVSKEMAYGKHKKPSTLPKTYNKRVRKMKEFFESLAKISPLKEMHKHLKTFGGNKKDKTKQQK